jgi:putative membrane protein
MIIELQLILAALIGLIAGTITGIIPGIHINLIAILIFTGSSYLLNYFSPITLAAFITSMAITHTFLDFIPSIFLGAPDEDTALSVLPGHKLLLKGLGYGAIKLTLIGSFFGLLFALLISPLLILSIPEIYPFISKFIPFILIAASLLLIVKEKYKGWAIIIFFLSGILGLVTLNFSMIKQPLLPLFSGLFGASLLTISVIKNVKIPEQKIKKLKIKKLDTVKAIITSLFSSLFVSFLPGVGASQAAVIGSSFKKRINENLFLIMVGAINTIVMVWSFIALYSIQKPRTGSAVIIGKFLDIFSQNQLILLLAISLFVGSLAVFQTLIFARIFAKNIRKINYKWLCFAILIFIIIITMIISGPLSLLVLATGTFIGIICSIVGVRKMQMMGCLLIPVIIYSLF